MITKTEQSNTGSAQQIVLYAKRDPDSKTAYPVLVDVDGQIITAGDIVWDTITPTYNATSDVYAFYLDSVLVKTITVSYTDATKEVMSGVTKV